MNFASYEEDYSNIYNILEILNVLPLEHLLVNILTNINSTIVAVAQIFTKIEAFKIDIENPQATRDQLADQLAKCYENLFNATAQWIPFLAYQQGDVAANIKKLTKSIEDANEIVSSAKTDIETKTNELDDIIEKAREASASAGAAVFTQEFSTEAGG